MLSVQPSLMFTTKGTKLRDIEATPMYLELPVFAAVRIAILEYQNIVIKAGPYFAYGVGGKYKEGDIKIDFFGDAAAKRFDCGLSVGVAYEFGQVFMDLTGEFGLTKITGNGGSPKNTNFTVGVGYKF